MTIQRKAGTLLVGMMWLASLAASARAAEPDKPAPQRVDAVGDPLPDGVLARIGTIRLRHAGEVTTLVFSPDGKYLASGGGDKLVRLWDATNWQPVSTWAGEDVTALDFAPDGKTLAASSRYGAIRIWNVATGRQVQQLPGHERAGATCTQALRFSPDGKHLSLADSDGNIFYREVAGETKPHSLRVERQHWFRISLSADGRLATSAGEDHAVRVWDVAKGKQLLELPAHKDYPYGAAFSPDGRYLASGGRTNKACLWELATGQLVYKLPSEDHVFAFAPDGRTLASTGDSSAVHLWDLTTGKERRQLRQGHVGRGSREVEFLAFSPNGQTLATGGKDGVIRIWDVTTGREKDAPPEQGGVPIAFLPDGKTLALRTLTTFRMIEIERSAQTPEVLQFKDRRRRDILEPILAASLDGKMLAAAYSRHNLFLVNVEQETEQRKLTVLDETSGISFSPDGKVLAVAERRGITLWNTQTAKIIRTLEGHKSRRISLAFAPDGKTLVSLGSEGDTQLRFWNVATGEMTRQLPLLGFREREYYAPSLQFSPSGKILAVSGPQRNLQLWDVAAGRKITDLQATWPVAFSPDGKILAARSGWSGQHIELWELATGKPLTELHGHEGAIHSLLFSPDGRLLVSGSDDHTNLIWDMRVELLGRSTGRINADELARCWKVLGEADAGAAAQALATLSVLPEAVMPFLQERAEPIPATPPERIRQWIADLNADEFAVREKALEELKRLGHVAAPQVREALKGKQPPEVKARLNLVLDSLNNGEVMVPPGNTLRLLRLIRFLESTATPEARQILERLAGGVPEAVETKDARAALERLKAFPRGKDE